MLSDTRIESYRGVAPFSKDFLGRIAGKPSLGPHSHQVERRQWWLWGAAIMITLLLLTGMASFSFVFDASDPTFSVTLRDSIRGLVALVFLFDLYTIFQQVEIHRMRRQLNDREEMFRLISENAEDLISVIDPSGKRFYNSPGYTRAFGYTEEELQGVPVLEQVHADDKERIVAARKEAFFTGTPIRVEYRFRRKDGDWRILESTGNGIRNSDGKIERLVIVSRDITERRRSEELLRQREDQLRQARKMEAVGRLSGGIAHDFNNLLGVIIGYSEVLELQMGQTSPLRKNVAEIIKAAERASGLTQQLLAFSRKKPLQPKILDLNSLVIDMGQMLRRLIGAHLDLTTRLASDLGKIRVDQGQIEQVILNLVVNARDAMPQGGKLSIQTANTLIDDLQAKGLPFLRPGPHVILTISDTGVGMDDDTRRQIFEPFFTTKDPGKGTGLGLSTVYSVVKQSGGVIGVQSTPGKGSTFQIYLPQATEQPAEPVLDESENSECDSADTILVVEDEEPLLILTCDALVENGYTVLAARDGVQALEIAKSYQEPIHLLLTDIAMPRMGGLPLAQQMISLRPGIRVLFMTAYSEHEPTLPSNLCRTESLSKPFSRNGLLQKVRRMLDRAEITALP